MRILFYLLIVIMSAPIFAQGPSNVQTQTSRQVDSEDESILQRHRPFYFAYGEPLTKVQASFKSPVFRGSHLYFGYTQVMFWALREESKPFRDLSYNPELFYRWEFEKFTIFKSIDFGIFGHTSNGKRDKDSRSLDMNYMRFNFEREGHRWLTRLSAQLSYLHNFDPTNADIQKYVSPLSLSLSFIQMVDGFWFDKGEVSLTAAPGGKFADRWDRGGYQLSWSFRLGGINLVPAFYLQYYYGYAETLLNYNERVREFRGGIIF